MKLKPKLAKYTENAFTIFRQNICGLPNKQEVLLNSLIEHPPQIICLTEHHLHDEELEDMSITIPWVPNFVGKLTNVGVCVYI
jgi:hypothetical protein